MNEICLANPAAASLLRSGLLAMAILSGSAVAVAAPQASSTITVTSIPDSVSVSRVDGTFFYVSYAVRVTNNSANNNLTYDFKGTTEVTQGKDVVPPSVASAEFVPAADGLCTKVSSTVITCSKLSVNKGTSKTFTVTYKTPLSGDKLKLTMESTSNAIKGSASAVTTLITQPYEQSITGFYTYVPSNGGTFYTGENGNGGPSNPGGVPKGRVDPFTTTIYVPSIPTATTALVAEKLADTCTLNFVNCYETSLTIPNTVFSPPNYLTVYLRVDATQLTPLSNLNSAVVIYDGNPVGKCGDPSPLAGNPPLPQVGYPCLFDKWAYPGNFTPTDFANDWVFVIKAMSNGTYRLR